jgi:hypothetical protein
MPDSDQAGPPRPAPARWRRALLWALAAAAVLGLAAGAALTAWTRLPADAGQGPVTRGSVTVEVVSTDSEGGEYLVRLRVTNASADPVTYDGWGLGAWMTDEHGRTSEPWGVVADQGDQIGKATIAPGGRLDDVLHFDEPPDDATRFVLTLPLHNVGGRWGAIRFAFPRGFRAPVMEKD